jgi:hypothetical protein
MFFSIVEFILFLVKTPASVCLWEKDFDFVGFLSLILKKH